MPGRGTNQASRFAADQLLENGGRRNRPDSQLAGACESYETIQTSICSLIGSVRRFVDCDENGEAIRTLGQLEGAVVAAWETVRNEKQHQIALLDAVGCLVAGVNSLLNPEGEEASRHARGAVDDSVSAIIRYLDPDQGSGPELPET